MIEGQDGNRVAINEMDSQITLSDGRQQGMSHYFGLNDFIATVKRADTLTSAPQSSSTTAIEAGTDTFTITSGGNTATIAYDNTTTLETLRDNIRTELEAAGIMSATEAQAGVFIMEDGNRYRLVIDHTSNLSIADNGDLTQTIGMTEDQPNLAGNMDVASAIKNDPSRIVRGELNADIYNTSTAVVDPDAAIPNLGPLVPPPINYTLTVGGNFTDVDIDYDTTSSLQDIADAINNSAILTDNNITAEVVFDSQLGGYKLSVIDADGDPFYFSDNGLPMPDSLTTVLGLGINFGIHEGDNSAANSISNAFERTDIDFEATDGLSGEKTSLTDYAAGIVATAATKAQVAQSGYEFQGNLVVDLSTRIQNEAGVNLDEEMSDLIIFQRAYSASARVISTVDEMFDELLNAV